MQTQGLFKTLEAVKFSNSYNETGPNQLTDQNNQTRIKTQNKQDQQHDDVTPGL